MPSEASSTNQRFFKLISEVIPAEANYSSVETRTFVWQRRRPRNFDWVLPFTGTHHPALASANCHAARRTRHEAFSRWLCWSFFDCKCRRWSIARRGHSPPTHSMPVTSNNQLPTNALGPLARAQYSFAPLNSSGVSAFLSTSSPHGSPSLGFTATGHLRGAARGQEKSLRDPDAGELGRACVLEQPLHALPVR